uniref:hypothetical protein n=1 Tax=Tessaracoccus timonensis TaxID=2161816 RepID=UPI000D558B96|nr:hypothetical protein [Tessaracoccus timonensis]
MSFQDAFEKYAPHFIWDAYDYANNSPQVEMLWLHIESNGTKSVAPATIYRINGKPYLVHDLHKVLDGFDYDDDAIRSLYRQQLDCWYGLYDESQPDELPTRMILRFRPEDQDFTADFHYGDLQPGIPEEEQAPFGRLVFKWIERLETTGNDSAAP